MEGTLNLVIGVVIGLLIGNVHGRLSVIKEAQALVAEAIMEIRDKYEI
jgi:uncharacterized membrane-anchored protein YhcB (DUF1043 family)